METPSQKTVPTLFLDKSFHVAKICILHFFPKSFCNFLVKSLRFSNFHFMTTLQLIRFIKKKPSKSRMTQRAYLFNKTTRPTIFSLVGLITKSFRFFYENRMNPKTPKKNRSYLLKIGVTYDV